MAFPHDYDNRGDIKTLRRAAWADTSGNYVAYAGGSIYAYFGYGSGDFNWDNAEGWGIRTTYYGSTEFNQWNEGLSRGDSSIAFESKSSLPYLMRLDSSGNNTSGTSGHVIRLQNGSDAYGSEAYSHGFFASQETSLTWAQCKTPNDGQWCVTFYARKSSSAGNSGIVRGQLFVLGCKYDSTNGVHMNFTGATDGGDATSGTLSSPKTGGTYYHSGKKTLTTSWVGYQMHFKFNGDSNCDYICLRLDIEDGDYITSGNTKIYFDRITLHPADIHLRGSGIVGTSGTDKSLNAASFGAYS